MKGKLSLMAVTAWLVFALSGCVPVPPPTPSPDGQPQGEAAKIASAMSAAPATIGKDATIYDWPAGEGSDFVLLRQGTNGWTCYPDWPPSPVNDPECNDPAMDAWFRALMSGAKQPPATTSLGIGYMMKGCGAPSFTDPYATVPREGEKWCEFGPHVMIIAPGQYDPKTYAADLSSPVQLMYANTPYQVVRISISADR